MSQIKKTIRKEFRDACLKRDKYSCVKCNFRSSLKKADQELDVHHITNRNELPNGGYVKDNGISLCSICHQKAEEYHSTGIAHPGYSIDDLYKAINSSFKKSLDASLQIK